MGLARSRARRVDRGGRIHRVQALHGRAFAESHRRFPAPGTGVIRACDGTGDGQSASRQIWRQSSASALSFACATAAYGRMLKNDVRYRFSIDLASLR